MLAERAVARSSQAAAAREQACDAMPTFEDALSSGAVPAVTSTLSRRDPRTDDMLDAGCPSGWPTVEQRRALRAMYRTCGHPSA